MATHHLTPLHRAALEVVAAHAGVPLDTLKVDVPPNPSMGDLAVACHPIAKATKQNPMAIAKAIADAFVPTDLLASATAAGPFVNFRANRPALLRWVIEQALGNTLVPAVGTGKTICIDYSSPNISKELAFHHIRSTGIGHALAQIFRALDYQVVGINHLGDWGTTHGMLIAAYQQWGKEDKIDLAQLDIAQLNELYVRWRDHTNPLKHEAAGKWMAAIVAGGDAAEVARAALAKEVERCALATNVARDWFKKLEHGDPEARALWDRFRAVSWAEFEGVYDKLGITFELVRGESAYEPDLADVMAELRAKQLVETSEGAQVVWLPDQKVPVIVEKSDGASTYATRDFASAKYRHATYQFDRSIYVVDRGQALHFSQVFGMLEKAGYAWAKQCEHVTFGLVRMGGKKTSTRGGAGVMLKAVLAEAKARALAKMAEADSPAAQLPLVNGVPLAEQVGIGAVLTVVVAMVTGTESFSVVKALQLTGLVACIVGLKLVH
ncbi:MAG: arginine--tRNA ligase [Proteobacteria bacterium]|nr:arginine--tRNA ligase [Pseudomonadota bacterium]